MPGIEQFSKKKRDPEEPKRGEPSWEKDVPDQIFKAIGGKPKGYTHHTLHHLWNTTYRMNVWSEKTAQEVPGKPGRSPTKQVIDSWFLVFSPGGELIRSEPPLPGTTDAGKHI